jgi:hypothetical protein
MGNAWMNPAAITISFMPDGTNLGGPTSNLFSAFNSRPSLNGKWQAQILKAAQMWAQQSNINLIVVPDNGTPMGGGNNQEGDPGMGDIRIGGYNFGNSTLAWSYQPPPANNFSLAGDIEFNTGMAYNIGQTYDLFTVAMHEFGHTLGLGQSSVGGSVMYPTYTGVKTGLAADDIAGIRSIYGARSPDAFGALNNSFSAATSLTNLVAPGTLTALEPNLDIATAGQSEYFSVVAPAGTSGTMQVQVQSQGLSLLAPNVTVYDGGQSSGAGLNLNVGGLLDLSLNLNLGGSYPVVGSANGAGQYGTTLTVNIPNAVAGETYYIQVQGADNTATGTGNYALGLGFGNSPAATEASPIIAYPNGTPLQSGGGLAQQAPGGYALVGGAPSITGISPDTSGGAGVTSANRITISGFAPGNETVTVYNGGVPIGTTVANAAGNWTFDNTRTALADGTYAFTATATDPSGNVSALSLPYGVTIATAPPAPPTFGGFAPGISMGGGWAIGVGTAPIFYGGAAPGSRIILSSGSTALGSTTADRNGHWEIACSTGSMTPGTYTFTATATDVAGVTSGLSSPLSVALLPPASWAAAAFVSNVNLAASSVLGTNPDGYIDTTTTPTITGTATANSEVLVLEDGVIIGAALVGSSGAWSFTCSTLTTGVHKLSFQDANMAGSFSAPTGQITIQV